MSKVKNNGVPTISKIYENRGNPNESQYSKYHSKFKEKNI